MPDTNANTQLTAVTSFINGTSLPASECVRREVIDPATGRASAIATHITTAEIETAVESAASAFAVWRGTAPADRGRMLMRVAQLIRDHSDELATAETIDTGKPLRQARDDAHAAARYFEFYAGATDKIGGTTIPLADGTFAYTVKEPLGVVAHITPWNSPLSQGSRGIAPSLATGNTVVVKPSATTPTTTVRLAQLIAEAGLPAGTCNVVVGDGAVGAALIEHPFVEHITFTGSVETGRKVGAMAAARVIGSTLELGGKSATLVFPDADLDMATTAGAAAAIRNSGQSCFATTRQVVHRDIYEEYLKLTARKMDNLSVGSGLDDPDLGPLATAEHRENVRDLVNRAVKDGAYIANRPDFSIAEGEGFFYPPILLGGVLNHMEIAQTEIFGPVQTVIPFETEEEAVEIANGTPYGLAAGLFTKDISRAHRLIPLLEAGQIQINKYPQGGVEVPFGGYKLSGLGREKGLIALEGYTQTKSVMIAF